MFTLKIFHFFTIKLGQTMIQNEEQVNAVLITSFLQYLDVFLLSL